MCDDTIPLGALWLQQFLLWVGTMITGTMCESLIVGSVKYETEEIRGRLQSRLYFMLSLGAMGGGPAGGLLLQFAGFSIRAIFMLTGLGMTTFLLPSAVGLLHRRSAAHIFFVFCCFVCLCSLCLFVCFFCLFVCLWCLCPVRY